MSSSNANSPSESIVGGKNKLDDNSIYKDNIFDNDSSSSRLHKKSKVDNEIDINDKEEEDNFDYSLLDTIYNTGFLSGVDFKISSISVSISLAKVFICTEKKYSANIFIAWIV